MKEFILCLFLGVFGVHKFYIKNYKMGLIYLFTVGLFGLGWLYDTVTIALNLLRKDTFEYKTTPIINDNQPIIGDYYYKQIDETNQILLSTTNIETYASRTKFMQKRLSELDNQKGTSYLQDFLQSREDLTKNFIDRYYKMVENKINELKTNNGKNNRITHFISDITDHIDLSDDNMRILKDYYEKLVNYINS